MKYYGIICTQMIKDISEVDGNIDDEISDYLLRTTVQLFKQTDNETKPLGCGVLFEFENCHFILTASHNLRGENRVDLFVRAADYLVSLEYEIPHFVSEIGNQLHDAVDLGVISIKTIELLELLYVNNTFIQLDDLSFSSVQFNSSELRTFNPDYIMFGFPESQTKLKYGRSDHWLAKALYFKCGLSSLTISDVQDSGFKNHIFCNRTNDGMDVYTKQKRKLPYLFGMSGCGLWRMDKFNVTSGKVVVKLCGIFYGVEKGFLVFTQIGLSVDLIRETFGLKKLPNLGYNLNWKRKQHTTLDAHKQG